MSHLNENSQEQPEARTLSGPAMERRERILNLVGAVMPGADADRLVGEAAKLESWIAGAIAGRATGQQRERCQYCGLEKPHHAANCAIRPVCREDCGRPDCEQCNPFGPRGERGSDVGPAGILSAGAGEAIQDAVQAAVSPRRTAQPEDWSEGRSIRLSCRVLRQFAVATVWNGGQGQTMHNDIIEAVTPQEAVGKAFEKRFQGIPLAMAAVADLDATEEPSDAQEAA